MKAKSSKELSLPGEYVKAPTVLLTMTGLKANEKLLWIVVKGHCVGENNDCFPSVARLGAIMGLKRRQTHELLLRLEQKGFLECQRRKGQSTILRPTIPQAPMQDNAQVEGGPMQFSAYPCAVECIPTYAPECTLIRGIESEELNQSTPQPSASTTPKEGLQRRQPRKREIHGLKTLLTTSVPHTKPNSVTRHRQRR